MSRPPFSAPGGDRVGSNRRPEPVASTAALVARPTGWAGLVYDRAAGSFTVPGSAGLVDGQTLVLPGTTTLRFFWKLEASTPVPSGYTAIDLSAVPGNDGAAVGIALGTIGAALGAAGIETVAVDTSTFPAWSMTLRKSVPGPAGNGTIVAAGGGEGFGASGFAGGELGNLAIRHDEADGGGNSVVLTDLVADVAAAKAALFGGTFGQAAVTVGPYSDLSDGDYIEFPGWSIGPFIYVAQPGARRRRFYLNLSGSYVLPDDAPAGAVLVDCSAATTARDVADALSNKLSSEGGYYTPSSIEDADARSTLRFQCPDSGDWSFVSFGGVAAVSGAISCSGFTPGVNDCTGLLSFGNDLRQLLGFLSPLSLTHATDRQTFELERLSLGGAVLLDEEFSGVTEVALPTLEESHTYLLTLVLQPGAAPADVGIAVSGAGDTASYRDREGAPNPTGVLLSSPGYTAAIIGLAPNVGGGTALLQCRIGASRGGMRLLTSDARSVTLAVYDQGRHVAVTQQTLGNLTFGAVPLSGSVRLVDLGESA